MKLFRFDILLLYIKCFNDYICLLLLVSLSGLLADQLMRFSMKQNLTLPQVHGTDCSLEL